MNEIDIAGINQSANTVKTITTNFSKKQAWLKELEQARQISSYDKNGESNQNKVTTTTDAEKKTNSLYEENTAIFNSETSNSNNLTANEVAGDVTSGAVQSSIGTVLHNGIKVKETNIYPMTQSVISSRSEAILTNRTISVQNLEANLKTEFKLQNMTLIPEANGVRIIFRDYRMDNKTLNDTVSKLKQELSELGIPVVEVVVNGTRFSEDKSI